MNSVVFQNAAGVPFAELVMSLPVEPERTAMFFRKPADSPAADGPEARALRPGQPQQYACDFRIYAGGTRVSFENDDGWRITAELDANDQGQWFAGNGRESLQGLAHGVHFESTAKRGFVGRMSDAIRKIFS